jgi:hypothetical protein
LFCRVISSRKAATFGLRYILRAAMREPKIRLLFSVQAILR